MSTKVYEAYKLRRPKELLTIARDAQRQGKERARHVLRELYTKLAETVKTNTEAYWKRRKGYEWWVEDADFITRLNIAHDAICEAHREQRGSLHRSPFDFRAEIAVTELNGSIYLRPVYGDGLDDTLNFLATDERLTDFRYWNNVDKPKDIGDEEWDRRGEVWDKMGESVVIIPVVNEDNFYLVDPFLDDARERVKAKKLKGVTDGGNLVLGSVDGASDGLRISTGASAGCGEGADCSEADLAAVAGGGTKVCRQDEGAEPGDGGAAQEGE